MLTGPDFLITAANEAAERSQPYAYEFLMMAQQAAMGQGTMVTEAIATRSLKEHEASPVAIILGAYQMASERGDAESVNEVLRVGMALLAKWPDYLVVQENHPSLGFKLD